MLKLKKIKKNINHSFVQGRLSNEVGGKYQHFPIQNWHNELSIAKKLNFDSIEWIISDFSNPLFNPAFLELINQKLKKNKIKISSISLDLIMDNALHTISEEEVKWLIDRINYANKLLKINRISIPIEERSRFNNNYEKKKALSKLNIFCKKLSSSINLCIETDMSPKVLNQILKSRNFKRLGLLLDIGNIRAHGFKIKDYFNKFSNKIYSIHIKYRDHTYGKSKLIPRKNFYELKYFLSNINNLKNLKDISFQTFKSKKNFLKNIKSCIRAYNSYVQ